MDYLENHLDYIHLKHKFQSNHHLGHIRIQIVKFVKKKSIFIIMLFINDM